MEILSVLTYWYKMHFLVLAGVILQEVELNVTY